MHLGDRDRHSREHQQPGERGPQPQHKQQPSGQLPADGERRPEPRWAESDALDEPGGARKARAAERAHRLLRPVGQKHRPERQPQSQQSQICQHLTPPTKTNNLLRNRDIRSLQMSEHFPWGHGSWSEMKPSPPSPNPLKLWIVLARAFDAVERHSRASIARFGLGTTEFGVLEVLYHKGELPVCEVRRQILVESSSTTYVVDKLVKRGLVRRRPSAADRRVTLLSLTPAGRGVIRRIFPLHAQSMRQAVGALPSPEQRQAIDLLRTLGLGAAERHKASVDLEPLAEPQT